MKIINRKAFIKQMDALEKEMKNSGLKGLDLLVSSQSAMLFELAKRLDEDVSAALERFRIENAK